MQKHRIPTDIILLNDKIQQSSGDKNGNSDEENGPEVIPDRPQVPSITTDKDTMSDVTYVTYVTSTQTGAATDFSRTSNTRNAEGTGLPSEKERDRCKQISLTDEQINVFCQVFRNEEPRNLLRA